MVFTACYSGLFPCNACTSVAMKTGVHIDSMTNQLSIHYSTEIIVYSNR